MLNRMELHAIHAPAYPDSLSADVPVRFHYTVGILPYEASSRKALLAGKGHLYLKSAFIKQYMFA